MYELINGELAQKSARAPKHQRISRRLFTQLNLVIEANKLGEVFCAPVDVFLNGYNVPQPDIVFVSSQRQDIIAEDGIMGVPDLAVEILSPGSVSRDRVDKMKLYRHYQLPEYWIVDPHYLSIEVYQFTNGDYELVSHAAEQGNVQSPALTGLVIDVAALFAE